MRLQLAIELVLAAGALLLLARDLHRAWLDQFRRPVTLLVAAVVAAVLVGTLGGRPHPSPWWLLLPGIILAWEVVRGWRRAPRCHLWEAGVGAFAASLLLAGAGLGLAGGNLLTALLITAAAAAVVGAGLLRRSRGREPRPWQDGDASHYERRVARRPES